MRWSAMSPRDTRPPSHSTPRKERVRIMEANESFKKFLTEIRLPDDLRKAAKLAHEDFRALIESDATLKPIIVDTFLQGSYRRHTGVKPKPGKKADVDVVVVTNLNRDDVTARQALDLFIPFLEKHYPEAYEEQGRSWAVQVGDVKLDLVPTSAPSEATQEFIKEARALHGDDFIGSLTRESLTRIKKAAGVQDWKNESLWIPDRDAAKWDETNPLEQISWTVEKNANTNQHYVNVVKVAKWWRAYNCGGEYPKGYPIEHLFGQNCPNDIESVAQGFTLATERIVHNYQSDRVNGTVPYLADHGVPGHDVLARITAEQFKLFYDAVQYVAVQARAALDNDDNDASADAWCDIFGEPCLKRTQKHTAYAAPTAPAVLTKGHFA
ncbi:MAG: SMODS domain-containing nucleotidyltransferase [Candidatus Dormibacteria bacterium]